MITKKNLKAQLSRAYDEIARTEHYYTRLISIEAAKRTELRNEVEQLNSSYVGLRDAHLRMCDSREDDRNEIARLKTVIRGLAAHIAAN